MSETAKLAVVTGASRGIGREIALTLAWHGWDVAFSHLGDEVEAAETTTLIAATGRKALSLRCDVGVKVEVWAFYQTVVTTFGRAPDVLVNNAGIQTWAPLLELAEADWDRVIRTNLKGCFLNTQRAAQLMVEHGIRGSIVNLGSACNKVAFPRLVDYTASKGGIEQFTKVSATELGPHGIRVNCVAPGLIGETAFHGRFTAPAAFENIARSVLLGRAGVPDEVATVVAFLASTDSSFLTGETIEINGGANMR